MNPKTDKECEKLLRNFPAIAVKATLTISYSECQFNRPNRENDSVFHEILIGGITLDFFKKREKVFIFLQFSAKLCIY